MTTDQLIAILQLITGSSLVLGLLLGLLALFYFRRSRRDAFWRFRRQAGRHGFRYSVMAVFLLTISGAFCMITLAVMFVEGGQSSPDPIQSMTVTDTPFVQPSVLSPIPSAASAEREDESTATLPPPTLIPTDTPIPPTATLLPVSTLSFPTVTLNPLLALTPTITASPTPLPPSRLNVRAVDDRISDDYEPLQREAVLPADIQRLYFFIEYEDMAMGERWSQVLLHNGAVIQEFEQVWGNLPPQGRTFFFFGNSSGYQPGRYEIQLRLGDEQSSFAFTLE